jgi:hypothetical protein
MQDPKLATTQILAIAPILQGQKESPQYAIPPRHDPAPQATSDKLPPPDTVDSETPKTDAHPHPVERTDTQTAEVDKFVDAPETS